MQVTTTRGWMHLQSDAAVFMHSKKSAYNHTRILTLPTVTSGLMTFALHVPADTLTAPPLLLTVSGTPPTLSYTNSPSGKSARINCLLGMICNAERDAPVDA